MSSVKFDSDMSNVGDRLRSALSAQRSISLTYGNVLSVDKDLNTMDITIDGKVEIRDISIGVVQGGDSSVLFFPAIGSLVVVGFVQGQPETAFPVRFTEAESVEVRYDLSGADTDVITMDDKNIFIKRGSSTCKIEDNLITLNGGNLGGLVVVGKLTSRLSALQSQIDAIQTAIMAHTHPYVNGVAPAVTSPATFVKVPLTPVKDTDYVNDKIKQ